MKRSNIRLFVLLAVVQLAVHQSQREPVYAQRELPEKADETAYKLASGLKTPQDRVEALRKFVNSFPESGQVTQALMDIFSDLVAIEAPGEAVIAAAEQSIAAFPDAWEETPWLRLTVYEKAAETLILRQEKLDETVHLIQKALGTPVEDDRSRIARAAIQVYLAAAYSIGGKPAEMIPVLRQSVEDDPTNEIAWFALGSAYEKTGQPEQALRAHLLAAAATQAKRPQERDQSEQTQLRSLYETTFGTLDGLGASIAAAGLDLREQVQLSGHRYDRVAFDWDHRDLSGKRVTLSDLRGHTASIISFWGTSCAPCREELRQLQNVREKYRDQDVGFVTLNVELPGSLDDRIAKVKAFLADNSITLPVALDLYGVTAVNYDVSVFPTTFVLDKAGAIRYRNAGESADLTQILEREIDALISGSVPTRPSPPSLSTMREASRLIKAATKMYSSGLYSGAIRLSERVAVITEKSLGADNMKLSAALLLIADSYQHLRDYQQSESYYHRIVPMFERDTVAATDFLPGTLHKLAIAESANGKSREAGLTFRRAIELYEQIGGALHPAIQEVLTDLGGHLLKTGNHQEAEDAYQHAREIAENQNPPSPAKVGRALLNLANAVHARRDDSRAIALLQRALAQLEDAFGADSAAVVYPLSNLAHIYIESPRSGHTEYAKAEELLRRAERIVENGDDRYSTLLAPIHLNLGFLYSTEDDYDRSEAEERLAMSLMERESFPESQLALVVNNLAVLDYARGKYADAETSWQRLKEVHTRIYGPLHGFVGTVLGNLAYLYEAAGKVDLAVEHRAAANAISAYHIGHSLMFGSERQKLMYLEGYVYETDATVSLNVRSAQSSQDARRTALLAVLQRKGLIVDSMSDSLATVRGSMVGPEHALFEQWIEKRSRLATLFTEANGSSTLIATMTQLTDEIEELERKLSAASVSFKGSVMAPPISIEAVQHLIPNGHVLVEYYLYHPFDKPTRSFRSGRYVAYILRPGGAPDFVDLGGFDEIDALVLQLRRALRDVDAYPSGRVKVIARALDDLVMRPVRERLGEDEVQVFLSPDGQLNLIPFEALVDENGQYLVDRFAFLYLSSGRDLLRLASTVPSRGGPVFLGSPSVPGSSRGATGHRDDTRILPGAQLLVGSDATKAALQKISGPSILHISAHGFFDEDTRPKPFVPQGLGLVGDNAEERARDDIQNPMLRSGLELAPATGGTSEGRDAILTAYEASALDLRGTKLVVLAACETGVGDVRNGEGVYGLRRALVLAGAESQIMSLWEVDPQTTTALFESYYGALLRGRGRAEALRDAQRRLLGTVERRHPYYWAAFIHSGAWTSLPELASIPARR